MDHASDHPTEAQLSAFNRGQVTEEELRSISAHLGACPACCARLDDLSSTDKVLGWLRETAQPTAPPVAASGPLAGSASGPLAATATSARPRKPATSPPAAPAGPSAHLPKRLGDYDILAEVGRGGMGVVYKARQRKLQRLAAVKTILAQEYASVEQLLRFQREAELTAQVRHPNVVQIYEVGTHGGRPFIAMEWVEGGSLARQLNGKPVPPNKAAQLLETLARAVCAAHGQGVLHRDLKPANILLGKQEGGSGTGGHGAPGVSDSFFRLPLSSFVPKITDFGLARSTQDESALTRSGAILGTPEYMAPEQATGRVSEIGPAADVYSLGVMLYELLTGRPPFRSDTPLATLRQAAEQEPVSVLRLQPQVPRDLDTICLKCLEKDPARRYSTAAALAEDLRRFLNGEPIAARPASVLERVWKVAKRHPTTAGLGLAVVLLVGFAFAVTVWGYVTAVAERDRTTVEKRRADDEAATAVRRKADADRELGRAEVLLYSGQIELAQSFWREYRADLAWHHLEATPAGHRGWEYHYLSTLFQSHQRTFQGHSLGVTRVCFNRDGTRFATCASPGGKAIEVKVWDVATARQLVTFTGPRSRGGPPCELRFNSDGSRLACASPDGLVTVLEVATGTEVDSVRLQPQPMGALCFNTDGTRVAGYVNQNGEPMVCVWDMKTGAVVHRLTEQADDVSATCFSPDGTRLAIAGNDRIVRLSDLATGGKTLVLKGHSHTVTSLCFNPAGTRLATASRDETVKVWDAADGQEILTLHGHTRGVNRVCFSPDGTKLASCGADQTARLWDAATGRELAAPRPHRFEVTDVCFTPDGQSLATADGASEVRLWDATTSAGPLSLKGHGRPIHALCFNADGLCLASASEDGTVGLWEPATGRERLRLRGHGNQVWGVCFTRDGKRVATASWDLTVRVWDAATGEQQLLLAGHTNRVHGVCFSRDGKRLASVSCDPYRGGPGQIKVWDMHKGRELLDIPAHQGPVFGVCFSPDGKLLASCSFDKTLKVWDAETGGEVLTVEHAVQLRSACFSPDGQRLAAAGNDGTATVWDAQTGKEVFTLRGHTGPVQSVCFSPDGRRLCTTSSDRTVKLWDAEAGFETMTLRGHTEVVLCACFSRDGRRLASAGQEFTVKVWDAGPAEQVGAGDRAETLP